MNSSAIEAKVKEGIIYRYANHPKPLVNHQYHQSFYEKNLKSLSCTKNLSYDRSVVRNINGQHRGKTVLDPVALQARHVKRMYTALEHKRAHDQGGRHSSPRPALGYLNVYVQTDLYLEELCDRVEQMDVMSQTDRWLSRLDTILYIPAKTGIDVATQIGDKDLFDFRREVRPIVEVLVSRTVEQALLEVLEEEELTHIREQQRTFEELRNADLAEMQRLENKDARFKKEKVSRMAEERARLRVEQETVAKLAARSYAVQYLEELEPVVLGRLNAYGYMYDPVERDIENGFYKELQLSVNRDIINYHLSRAILDNIIKEVVLSRKALFGNLDRDIAEWKQVAKAILLLHEECSWLATDDIANLAEHMLYLARTATDTIVDKVSRDILQRAVDQYALEEAAAQTAVQAAADVDEDS